MSCYMSPSDYLINAWIGEAYKNQGEFFFFKSDMDPTAF